MAKKANRSFANYRLSLTAFMLSKVLPLITMKQPHPELAKETAREMKRKCDEYNLLLQNTEEELERKYFNSAGLGFKNLLQAGLSVWDILSNTQTGAGVKELEEQKKHEHDQIMKFVKRNRRIPGYRLIQIAEQYALMYQEDVRLAADEENFYLIYADGEVLQEE